MILKLGLFNRKTCLFGIFSLIIASLTYSCIDDDYDLRKISSDIVYNPSLALTVGNINLDLKEFLNKMDSTVLRKTPDGMFYIVFEKDILSYKGEDRIVVPGQIPLVFPAVVFPAVFASDSVVRDTVVNYPISLGASQQIDSILLKSLSIRLEGTSNLLNDGSIQIAFTSVLKKGIPYKIRKAIPKANAGSQVTVNFSSDPQLAQDYIMNLGKDNNGAFIIPLKITYTLYGTKGSLIDITKYMRLNMSIEDLKYKTMFGYLGRHKLLDLTDNISTKFLDQEMARNIEWKDPKAQIILANSFGTPIRFYIDNISILPRNSTITDNVTPSGTGIPKDIRYPGLNNKVITDTIVLDNKNSNLLFKGLENAPSSINYKLTAWSNPDEKVDHNNMVFDTSSIKGKFRFELPVYFRSSGLEHTDTMEMDLFGDSETSVKSLLFRVVSTNELPVDIMLQMYFVDERNNIVSTLFSNVTDSERVIIKGSDVDTDGNLLKSREFKKDIIFSDNALKGISKAKKIIYTTRMMTSGYTSGKPYVKFKDGLKLKVSFICQVQTSVVL